MSGNDLNRCGDKTKTPHECREMCQKESKCVQFTWLGENFGNGARAKQCCMKNIINHHYTDAVGAYSGPKFCGISLYHFSFSAKCLELYYTLLLDAYILILIRMNLCLSR